MVAAVIGIASSNSTKRLDHLIPTHIPPPPKRAHPEPADSNQVINATAHPEPSLDAIGPAIQILWPQYPVDCVRA
jgi:hypothetical protein